MSISSSDRASRVASVLRRCSVELSHGTTAGAIGTDCVDVARVDALVRRRRERFVSLCFTAAEIEYCQSKQNPALHFAGRLAAKEAVYKVLDAGWVHDQISWRDIEIVARNCGPPDVILHNNARAARNRAGIQRLKVSISHDAGLAVAVALAV